MRIMGVKVIKRIYIGIASGVPTCSRERLTGAFGSGYVSSLHSPESLLGAQLLLDMLERFGIKPGRRTLISRLESGKPHFEHTSRISFSISHSNGTAVCALSFGGNVGIDIECCRRLDPDRAARLAERWLTPRGFGTDGTVQGFLEAWTAFEAASKYAGGTLAECRGIPDGACCGSYTLESGNSRYVVSVCHDCGVPLIPLGSFGCAVTERPYILGIGFDVLTKDEAVERAAAALASDRLMTVVTPNPVISMNCLYDTAMYEAVRTATLSLADGRGVIDAAGRCGLPLTERVAGIDFGYSLLRRAAERGSRVFLLGGKPGRAKKAAARLCGELPGLNICGTCDGYDGVSDKRSLEAALEKAHPDILFVCLGSPRQELWIAGNRDFLDRIGVRVAAALGGALDVWSGEVRRAPALFIRLRLEWLWRCLHEPRRLRAIPTLVRYRILTRK